MQNDENYAADAVHTDILDNIVARRKQDRAALGWTFGAHVPETRCRAAPVPFIAEKGVVLEIKRASPSKGDIAPALDAAATAAQYAAAGASAISVLTESHWFKGSLDDIQEAARAADDYAAAHGTPRLSILRKDFLFAPEEVDVAYRAGADAVLLIARILDDDTLCAMMERCAALGMTAFLELREEEDLRKLSRLVQTMRSGSTTKSNLPLVCGVNARDLRDFSIDLLTPASLSAEIRAVAGSGARVIFESGIRTPAAARFAGSLGFTGMLLGEAAARNPCAATALVDAFTSARETANARFWCRHAADIRARAASSRPFVKICGLTRLADALKAAALGADFLGFIFYEQSPRRADERTVRTICAEIKRQYGKNAPQLVGVAVDTEHGAGARAQALVAEGVLDVIQLHGFHAAERFLATDENAALPHYAAVNLADENDLTAFDALRLRGEPRILIDAKDGPLVGGTGTRIADTLVAQVCRKTRLWIAGGITPENVRGIADTFHPELLDVASGVEASPGTKDHKKLAALFSALGAERPASV